MKAKPKRQVRRKPTPKAALMRIPAPPSQPWNLSLAEVDLVRNHIAKGASDTELQFCLAVARRHKLDPFSGQIWFVKRRDSTAEGGYRWIPITGINGMLHIAARDHKDFGSNDEPEFGPMHAVKWSGYNGKSGTIQAPEWASVKLWKKGHEHPIVAKVFWEEIYPDVSNAPLVRQMPRLMLGKCALAQAVRRAYPATDGLYIKEEFQGPPEFTPAGRVMEVIPPKEPDCAHCGKMDAPDGCAEPTCPIRSMGKLTAPQKEIAERKIAEAKSSRDTQPAKEPGAERSKDPIPAVPDSLRYQLTPSGLYEITGPDSLKTAHKDLLGPLYSKTAKCILAKPAELGKLISEFERRKLRFKEITDSD
jgi:hypothetical protein